MSTTYAKSPQTTSASVGDIEVYISLLSGISHPGQSYSRRIESEGLGGQFVSSQSPYSTVWERSPAGSQGPGKVPSEGVFRQFLLISRINQSL